jgi:hypothetical protein
MKQIKPVDGIWLRQQCSKIEKKMADKKYWMLLCKELADYTVFYATGKSENPGEDLFETLTNRGIVLDLTQLEDGNYEVWIKDMSGEPYVYYLFDYSFGIVEV